ncbi:response regulator [Elusimicrobiota bacterium]
MSEEKRSHKAKKFLERLPKKMTRQIIGSLAGCVHCGMCTESCHYMLSNPDDPTFAPAHKADQLRKIFKKHIDWTGRVFPWWVSAKSVFTDEDLEKLKDIAFGKCTNCRRCTFNCPMGVDFATANRTLRGLLVHVGVMPEGVAVVSKDQWEVGNQMGVLKEDYLETLEWMSDELVGEVGDEKARIRIDTKGANVVYSINPREVKYDPRSISDAAKIFWVAGESWCMPSDWWDQTNFGLFSGDDDLGGNCAKRLLQRAVDLEAKKLVISECGHGYRSTRCEGQNWAGKAYPVDMESSVITMLRYISQGKIKVDKSRNEGVYTFHDSCNNARSCGLTEEPRELLQLVVPEFREMYPNRAENYCCTGGGGAMSMSEYTPNRLKSGKIKAEQLKATGAGVVVTSCHNCVDGLNDLIKHYKLDMKVTQLVNLVATALVIPAEVKPPVEREAVLAGRTIMVVDDEPDALTFFSGVLGDNGAKTIEVSDGNEVLQKVKKEKPDLVTLDLNMPGKDGGKVFEELRKDPETEMIKVCIITGKPELRKLIYERPVRPPEGFIEKPVDEKKLLTNVRKVLELARDDAPVTA